MCTPPWPPSQPAHRPTASRRSVRLSKMVIATKGIKESMPAVQGQKRFVENSRCYHHQPRSANIRLSPLRIRRVGANYGHDHDLHLSNFRLSSLGDLGGLNKSSRHVRFALPSTTTSGTKSGNTTTYNNNNSQGHITASNGFIPGRTARREGITPPPLPATPLAVQRTLPTATATTTAAAAGRAAAAARTQRISTALIGGAPHSRASRRPSVIVPQPQPATTTVRLDARRPIGVVVPARRAAAERQRVVNVAVAASPGVRARVHPTGRYACGTLSPTASAGPAMGAPPGGRALLRAAADGDDDLLRDLLRRASPGGIPEADLNAADRSGRTILSHLASNGPPDVLERILLLPGLHPNQSDNEGNTALHFAAQAGQAECLNCMLSRCKTIEVDARNNMGFTPLMKAALQGRYKCAKMLLFAGANPTLKDDGRGLRADQWARFCGRYVCADVIEKHARQKLLERTTSYGNWGNAVERPLAVCKVPVTSTIVQHSTGIRSRLKKVFRTSSSGAAAAANAEASSVRLVTQLTTAALCASTPVLPAAPSVPPVVKSLIRPLTVPRLQITLANGDGDYYKSSAERGTPTGTTITTTTTVTQSATLRMKKSK